MSIIQIPSPLLSNFSKVNINAFFEILPAFLVLPVLFSRDSSVVTLHFSCALVLTDPYPTTYCKCSIAYDSFCSSQGYSSALSLL